MGLSISKEFFGQTPEGPADIYSLENSHGMRVSITNYGGIIQSLYVPDRDGNFSDVVHGFDSLDRYLERHPFFGAIVGRYGNRIGKGRFTLEGHEYSLATNNSGNHIHGGLKGFDKHLWEAREIKSDSAVGVQLSRVSPDMEEGYPGNLDVEVTYLLNNDNELLIEYLAGTDKTTHCNLTNHSYFNLSGAKDILGHELQIESDYITEVDEALIPTGELLNVAATPFDFNRMTSIGDRIDDNNVQLQYGRGYDHNFVLRKAGDGRQLAVTVYEPATGRVMEVLTEEPGVQFYTGNFLDGSVIGKNGVSYGRRSGFCLETQHYPDSPNKPHFPSTIVTPEQAYRTSTLFRFSVRE